MLKLLVSDARKEIREIWEGFKKIDGGQILDMNISKLLANPDIDAILMQGIYAHERYGGHFIEGKSQVLRTHSEPAMPPWVVTTPPLKVGKLRETLGEKGKNSQCNLSSAEEIYTIFREVLLAIDDFNTNHSSKINVLGVELDFLNLLRGDMREDVKMVKMLAEVIKHPEFEKIRKHLQLNPVLAEVIKHPELVKIRKHLQPDPELVKIRKHLQPDQELVKIRKHLQPDPELVKIRKHLQPDQELVKVIKHLQPE